MEVVTFYSYKGGVGRTLLLAWVARALAARGKRVLALDLDLEAPGLPSKLRPVTEPQPGFGVVDLLLRFQGGASPPTDLAQWCLPVAGEEGGLWLLPAGAAPSPAYWQALGKVSWETLFVERAADGARFFLWLRDALAKALEPEFLLIDARTGVTEMGAAAVGMLADTVVAVTNMSLESKTGLREVLRAAVGSPRASRPPLRVLPVLSRVPALLGADDDARIVDQLRRFLNEEAEPLTSTLAVERVLAIHHEEALLEDEQRALVGSPLRVVADYARVLAWIVREQVLGPSVNLSLSRSSQLIEVIRAQEEVITAYRESAATDPVIYSPMLADALASSARTLAQLGRREDALAAAEEAVVLHRRELARDPSSSDDLASLASALRARGLIQSELGRREDALASAEEVVVIRREQAKRSPAEHMPDLAQSLIDLGRWWSELGQRENALACTEEAVAILREVTERWPVFLLDLAASLSQLGNRQGELGREEEALLTTEEAVAIQRALARQRPEAFLPDLAASLTDLGDHQRKLERFLDSLASTEEAAFYFREMAKQRPERFLPSLAKSLTNLGDSQSELGIGEQAVDTVEEAVGYLRQLSTLRPETFLLELARALGSLSACRSRLGRHEEALTAAGESISLLMSFARGRPEAFTTDLQRALAQYTSLFQALGRSPDADPLVIDAREILRNT